MTALHGSPQVPFSEMFADTVRSHGSNWAYSYYVRQHKMPYWEFSFWLFAIGVSKAAYLY